MTDYTTGHDSPNILEAGGVTRFLGDLLMQQRQNDMELQQLRNDQLQVFDQMMMQRYLSSMEQQQFIPPEMQQQVDLHNQQALEQYQDFSNGLMQDLVNMQAWNQGAIGMTMVGGAAQLEWLANNPLPEITPAPQFEPFHYEPENATVIISELPSYDESATVTISDQPAHEAEQPLELTVPVMIQEIFQPIEQPYQELQGTREQIQQEIAAPTDQSFFAQLLGKLSELVSNLIKEIKGIFGAEVTEAPTIELPAAPEQIIEGTDRADIAAEGIKAIFTPDVLNRWGGMSIEQREQYVKAYSDYLCASMGISADIKIEYLEPGLFGSYNYISDTITINTRMLDDGTLSELGGLLDTVIHEMRHNLQREAVAEPERFPDIPSNVIAAWRENQIPGNYILYSDDPRGYDEQPIEADAWGFAAEAMRRADWQYGVDDYVSKGEKA